MERRKFLFALAGAATALGLGDLSTLKRVKARGDDLIRVSKSYSSSVGWQFCVDEKFLDRELRRAYAEAEAMAESRNWRNWKKRVVEGTQPNDMDGYTFEVVLERIA